MIEDFRMKVFEAASELGSFTAAAKALGVTQPAVSQNIAEIEKLAGTKLFDRGVGRCTLTPEGRSFLNHAKQINAAYGRMNSVFSHPESTLLKSVMLGGKPCNILIEKGYFSSIGVPDDTQAERVIDASGTAILPSLFNTHTHAAMTLLRGYADDLPLQQWLEDYIWPYEDKLSPSDIRKGSEIACREMMSSGTTFFSDMYFDIEETIGIVEKTGMRAAIGITVMQNHSKAVEDKKKDFIMNWSDPTGGRIQLVMAPHAIYTVGTTKLRKTAEFARRHGLKIHIHLAETKKEVDDCIKEYGTTPVRYLDKIGFLDSDVIAAHCVYVDEQEWGILARRGVTVSHCPCSNMKLGSGRFPYELALESGCRITLGTDGASSNNNLDLLEEMKFAALLAKVEGNPTLLKADEVFRWATINGAQAFGIDAGEIRERKVADAMLVNLDSPRLQPGHSLVSDMVYSADSSVVSRVFCCGQEIYGPGR
ncbi:MAG TPA: chlorohydrolase [Rikenellaceae bacterium]|nr:hypothetical protein [Rikenellaceae bacterium]HBH21159.1 chlorohydrolase [Rikenellaceae bacterium]